jgi:hypothetical protein
MPAQAAPVEQLRCIDDRLNERQRADIAGLFAQQPDDPAGRVKTAQGSAAASRDMTLALASCTARFGWSRAAQDAASRYLVEIARLARIAVDRGVPWSAAMERHAPLAVKRLPDGKTMEEHLRAQIVAGHGQRQRRDQRGAGRRCDRLSARLARSGACARGFRRREMISAPGRTGQGARSARAASASAWIAHSLAWSLIRPIACMKAWTVVGPTNFQPRFLDPSTSRSTRARWKQGGEGLHPVARSSRHRRRASPFGDQLQRAAGVVDHRLDLAAVADDAGILQQPFDIAFVEAGNAREIEAVERGAEIVALHQDGAPAQARLEAFERELFEQPPIVVHGKPHSRS